MLPRVLQEFHRIAQSTDLTDRHPVTAHVESVFLDLDFENTEVFVMSVVRLRVSRLDFQIGDFADSYRRIVKARLIQALPSISDRGVSLTLSRLYLDFVVTNV